MTTISRSLAVMALLVCAGWAQADDWKDESGKGRRNNERREMKEEFWDGNCKVERKYEKDGEFKEERKCKRPARHSHHQPPREHEDRVYYEEPVRVPVQRGVQVDVRIRN